MSTPTLSTSALLHLIPNVIICGHVPYKSYTTKYINNTQLSYRSNHLRYIHTFNKTTTHACSNIKVNEYNQFRHLSASARLKPKNDNDNDTESQSSINPTRPTNQININNTQPSNAPPNLPIDTIQPNATVTPSDALLSSVSTLPLSTRIWNKVKHEARHYWHGTKLLAAETRISWYIVKQVLHGKELTRRERKQLQRSASDLLRLVPFLAIVLIPFAELALPILLKLFPNLLPSTFADHTNHDEQAKKRLALKIDMAKFLQETTVLMTNDLMARKTNDEYYKVSVNEFNAFIQRIRSGESVAANEIAKYSALFNEDFTLENLNRQQLIAMCELLDIKVFGNEAVLRHKLQSKLRELKKDDRAIDKEGVNSLSNSELVDACNQRGIHTGKGIDYMRRKLNEWIQLSIYLDVPTPLLILSRAFSVTLAGKTKSTQPSQLPTTHDKDEDLTVSLAQTIAHLPDSVVQDTTDNVVTRSVASTDNKTRLQLLNAEHQRLLAEQKLHEQRNQQLAFNQLPNQQSIIAPVDLELEQREIDDIKYENDEVEHDIDTNDSQHRQHHIDTTTNDIQLHTTQPSSTATTNKSFDKEEKRVDKLNDKLEAYLENIKRELQQLSKEDLVKRLMQEQMSKNEINNITSNNSSKKSDTYKSI